MIPVPLYLAHLQGNLLAGYTEFRLEMSAYLGYGPDPTLWTSTQSAELDRGVQEAYRYILYPSKIPGGSMPHVWSWLRQVATLTTEADTATYTLPAAFGSMHSRHLTYASETGWVPVERTSAQQIRERNQWSSYSEHPWLYALKWAAQTAGVSQRQTITFYPIPDDAYTLSYEYAVLTGKLSTTNPFPLGGPRMSQLMIEACKAVGEAKKNGQRGDQWNIFREQLADAIAMDASTLTERTVGQMQGQYDAYDRFGPAGNSWAWGERSLSGSTYTGVS